MTVAVPDAFSATGAERVGEKWWRSFGDSSLSGLVEEGLLANYDLLATWDRLAQAEASAKKADAQLGLWADLDGGIRRTRQEKAAVTTYSTTYSMGLAADAAITIAGSIADTWYRLAEAKALDAIIGQQVATNQKVLEIVTTQFRKGAASGADVLRQRQLVVATEAQKIAVEQTSQLLQYRLSILIGRAPSAAWREEMVSFPALSPLPDVGVPGEVLWRRPDVRTAYRQVQAADHRLAAAVADQYPRLSLAAGVETSGTSSRDLKAEVKRREAIVSEALHLWSQSVLLALEEVEDALTQEYQQQRTLENLGEQLDLARQTSQQNRDRYIKGQIDYIRVLESLQSLQSLERSLVSAQRAVVQSRISLYRAIAGGWELRRPAVEEAMRAEEPPGVPERSE